MTRTLAATAAIALMMAACGGEDSDDDGDALAAAEERAAAAEDRVSELEAEVEALNERLEATTVATTPTTIEATATTDATTTSTSSTTTTSSTSTTTTEPTPTEWTLEEVHAILSPPAQAWLASPSPETYDALSAAAQTIYDDRTRTFPEFDSFNPNPLTEGFNIFPLTTYPGDDNTVIGFLDNLELPGLPPLIRSGNYLVGDGPDMVAPGTYVARDVENCYWETLDAAGEINDNNFVSAAPQVIMVVHPGDFAVNLDSECGTWLRQ